MIWIIAKIWILLNMAFIALKLWHYDHEFELHREEEIARETE